MENKKIKILLVDDDELIRICFRDIFWIHGLETDYDVLIASGVEEAEKFIWGDRTTKPDIIFLDLIMPRHCNGRESTWHTGIDLLKKIKEDPKTKDIKVVVYTAIDDDDVKKQVAEFGIESYLVKGDNLPKDLIDLLKKLNDK